MGMSIQRYALELQAARTPYARCSLHIRSLSLRYKLWKCKRDSDRLIKDRHTVRKLERRAAYCRLVEVCETAVNMRLTPSSAVVILCPTLAERDVVRQIMFELYPNITYDTPLGTESTDV